LKKMDYDTKVKIIEKNDVIFLNFW
jgi:hypothetical protein